MPLTDVARKVPEDVGALFETLKAEPGKPGVDNLQTEITKLHAIRAVGLEETLFVGVPWKVLQMLKRRASNEKASERANWRCRVRRTRRGSARSWR